MLPGIFVITAFGVHALWSAYTFFQALRPKHLGYFWTQPGTWLWVIKYRDPNVPRRLKVQYTIVSAISLSVIFTFLIVAATLP